MLPLSKLKINYLYLRYIASSYNELHKEQFKKEETVILGLSSLNVKTNIEMHLFHWLPRKKTKLSSPENRSLVKL